MEQPVSAQTPAQSSQPALQPVQPLQQPAPQPTPVQLKQPAQPTESKLQKLKAFYAECVRVLRVTKKPDKEEFKTIVKVSGVGMLIIGLIGFLVHFLKEILLPPIR